MVTFACTFPTESEKASMHETAVVRWPRRPCCHYPLDTAIVAVDAQRLPIHHVRERAQPERDAQELQTHDLVILALRRSTRDVLVWLLVGAVHLFLLEQYRCLPWRLDPGLLPLHVPRYFLCLPAAHNVKPPMQA